MPRGVQVRRYHIHRVTDHHEQGVGCFYTMGHRKICMNPRCLLVLLCPTIAVNQTHMANLAWLLRVQSLRNESLYRIIR